VNGLASAFRASADRWNVPIGPILAINAIGVIGMPVLAALFFLDRDAFGLVLDEDRIVEWAQVALYLGTAVLAVVIAWDRLRRGYRVQAATWLLAGLFAIVIVGEEIAWGQRLLGLETPEILEEVNKQDEITFHNIGETLTAFNVVLFIASVYAIAAEAISRRWPLFRRVPDGDRLYVPPFFLSGLFAVMATYRIVRTFVLNQESYALTNLSEWAELCFVGALFITVMLSARWLARHPTTVPLGANASG
jgi:hypothetical protein